MRNYQVTPEQIITELYNIFSDEHRSRQYYNTMGAQFIGLCGWAGPMSPENRAAFIDAFGLETIETAEKVARARVAAYRAAYEASHYHRHEIEANEADPDQVPAVGSFVWCFGDGLKCEGGPMDPLKNHCEEWSDFRPELVEIAAVVTVPAADLLTADTAHRIAREYTGHQGGRYEEADPLRLDGRPYAWTVGVLVTDGARWYVVDSEGYDYARYILQPLTMADMYAPEIADLRAQRAAVEAQKEAEEQAAKAARLAEYRARCARWDGAGLVDVRPLIAAESAAYGTREKSQIRSASAKLSAARRKNIAALIAAAFPGVKFSIRANNGWGAAYRISWTDGPTVETFRASTDVDLLFTTGEYYSNQDDSYDYDRKEFTDFAEKFMGFTRGGFDCDRHESQEFRDEIAARIREAVPGLPEGDQVRIDEADALEVAEAADIISGDRAHRSRVVDMAERWGLLDVVAYVARITDRPTITEAPTGPTPDNGGTGATYGDCEKSQPQEEAPALQLVDIDGEGVAVVGDSRTTYRHRRLIKACGAKWNKTAQQWEAYDPEAIANLREWLPACRPARPTDPDGLGEEETAPAPAVDATPTKEESAQLPDPPAAVVYDASQPIESARFVAVDATGERYRVEVDGRPYGVCEKSQLQEMKAEALRSGLADTYFRLKEKHPDALLLFRSGDFYNLYRDDATAAREVLGLEVKPSTECQVTATFPAVALDTYLPKLIRSGHRVAICDSPAVYAFPITDTPTGPAPDNGGTGDAYGDREKSQICRVVLQIDGDEAEWTGATPAEAVEAMWRDDEDLVLDGYPFTIEGDPRRYAYSSTIFHYCFDHGRINFEEALTHCVAE